MLLAIDTIHLPDAPVRRLGTNAAADAALAKSVRALGILQPILVRPNGNGYILVAGGRRLAAARAAGLTEIPAEIREMETGTATAAQAAENLARAALDPLDQWRAIVNLQASGYTLPDAAIALCIPERLARRLDKLGRLHPHVLREIEAHGLPEADELAIIASAPEDVQARAIKAARKDAAKGHAVHWNRVANDCQITRLPLDLAIFDPAATNVIFEEDLFAEPGSPDQFTTADVPGFLAAQREALATKIKQFPRRSIELADWDAKAHAVKIPSGFTPVDLEKHAPEKGGTQTLFVTVMDSGYRIGHIRASLAEDKAKAKARDQKAKANTGTADEAAPGEPEAPDTEDGEENDDDA